MSVINDMLRDLEQRKSPDRTHVAPGEFNSSLIEARQVLPVKFLVLIGALLLAIGFGLSQAFFDSGATLNEVQHEVPVGTEQDHADNPDTQTETDVVTANKLIVPDTSNTRIAAQVKETKTSTNLQKETGHNIGAVSNTQVVTSPPKPVRSNKPSQKPASSPGKPVPAAVAATNVAEVSANEKSAFQAATRSSVRKPSTLPPDVLDRRNAIEAARLFAAGESRKAYRMLYEYLSNHKIDIKSRIVLVSHLLQDDRNAEAGDILITSNVELDAELRQLKARWYVAKGENNLAIHTLRSNLPVLEEHPDYYALLASYYQRFGFAEKAAETYAGLVEFDAESADWWAGFAIALDSSRQYGRAANAYQQALKTPELNPELIDYIRDRLSVLNPELIK